MALKDTKFDAFISYRHTELDKFVAETLHKKLEAFRIPSSIKKKHKLPKDRIRRVFRDRDELPLASSLAEQITDALQNSEYLIVVCTPRLPQSQWCLKEIDTFIELHGRDKIYAILAEGEPQDSFPPQLLYDEKIQFNEEGVAEVIRTSVEPLAADVRGSSKNEIRKKMNDEILRLIAPMFGLNYDDLKQRHREQKMKRILSFTLAISVIFLVFGIFSSVLSLKIQQQADEIFEQNQIITEKNDEILAQSSLLEEQNKDLLKSYAVSMSLESQKLILEGQKHDSLYALRTAMPDSLADTSVPYTPQTQYTLTNLLDLYEPLTHYYPQVNYDLQAPVNSIKVSPDEKTFLMQDSHDTLFICNIGSPTPVKALELCESSNEYYYDFYDNDSILFNSPAGLFYYNFITGESKELSEECMPVYKIPSEEAFIVMTYDGIQKMDLTGKIYWSYSSFDLFLYSDVDIAFSTDGNYALISNYNVLIFLDTSTGEYINSFEYTKNNPSVLYGNYFYFCECNLSPKYSTLYCYDITTGSMVWSKKYDDMYIYDVVIAVPDDIPYLIVNDYNKCYSFDVSSGDIISQAEFERGISILSTTKNLRVAVVSLYNGENHAFLPDSGTTILPSFINTHPPIDQLIDIIWIHGACFYQYLSLPKVTYYAPASIPDEYEEICTNVDNPLFNQKGDIYFTNDLVNAYFYHTGEDQPFLTVPLENQTCRFVGDGSQYYMLSSSYICNIYSYEESEPCYSIESDFMLEIYPDYIAEITDDGNNEYSFRLHSLSDFNKTFDFAPSEADIISEEICLSENEIDYVCINTTEGTISFRSREDSGKNDVAKITSNSIQSYAISNDGKYLFVSHIDNRLEIYETETGTLIKTHYDSPITIYDAIYNDVMDIYFISSMYSHEAYCFDANMDLISYFTTFLQLSSSGTSVLCYNQNVVYELPIYSYEQLIKMTDEILGDYVPSEQILTKHNISH